MKRHCTGTSHCTAVLAGLVITCIFGGYVHIYGIDSLITTGSPLVEVWDSKETSSYYSTSTHLINATAAKDVTFNGPAFINISELLSTRPDQDDVLHTKPVMFLKDVKNPCFPVTNKNVNVGNINITVAIQKDFEIRCIPYFYIAGFTKCGTSDTYKRLSAHRLIRGGYKKFPTKSGGWRVKKSLKEAHFWDNMYFRLNNTFDSYFNLYSSENIVESFSKYGSSSAADTYVDDFRNLLYGDSTPRTIWHGDTWNEDPSNMLLKEPVVLLPHKLHHVNPNAKIIVTLRNPTNRLLSDFKFYYRGKQTPKVFHSKVVDAIDWWNNCTQHMGASKRACAYGKAPEGLPELGFEACIIDKTRARKIRKCPYETGVACQSLYGWEKNSADRLRVSMYDLYIKDWLEIIPRENFLFLRFEDYSKEPANYIEKHVLPFLGLPPYKYTVKGAISSASVKNKSNSPMAMLPETKELLDQFYQATKTSLANLLNDTRFLWSD